MVYCWSPSRKRITLRPTTSPWVGRQRSLPHQEDSHIARACLAVNFGSKSYIFNRKSKWVDEDNLISMLTTGFFAKNNLSQLGINATGACPRLAAMGRIIWTSELPSSVHSA